MSNYGWMAVFCTLLTMSTPALSQYHDSHAWYGRMDIGWSHMLGDDVHFMLGDGTQRSGHAHYTNGAAYQFGIGKQINSMLREEIAFLFTDGNNPKAQLQSTVLTSKTDSMSLFANTFIDFQPWIQDFLVGYNPYLTAGLGISRNHVEYLESFSPSAGSEGRILGNHDYKAAWQYGGGIAWKLGKRTTLDLSAKRYYFGSIQSSLNDTIGGADLREAAKFNLNSVQFQLGLRREF